MSNVKKYTNDQLLARVKSLTSYKTIPTGRWIIGVRSDEDEYDVYDDKFYEFEGENFVRVLTGTTNAGASILKGGFKSFNPHGAAILASDEWYYDVWQYGLHRGKMPALRQVGSKVKVHRDGDMDKQAEELGKPILGWYGINYHTNTYDFSAKSLKLVKMIIGAWSAGCQVINEREKYMDQMAWYRDALKTGKQKFVSYCLLKEF